MSKQNNQETVKLLEFSGNDLLQSLKLKQQVDELEKHLEELQHRQDEIELQIADDSDISLKPWFENEEEILNTETSILACKKRMIKIERRIIRKQKLDYLFNRK